MVFEAAGISLSVTCMPWLCWCDWRHLVVKLNLLLARFATADPPYAEHDIGVGEHIAQHDIGVGELIADHIGEHIVEHTGVGEPIVEHIGEHIVDHVGVGEPIVEHIGDHIADHIVEPIGVGDPIVEHIGEHMVDLRAGDTVIARRSHSRIARPPRRDFVKQIVRQSVGGRYPW